MGRRRPRRSLSMMADAVDGGDAVFPSPQTSSKDIEFKKSGFDHILKVRLVYYFIWGAGYHKFTAKFTNKFIFEALPNLAAPLSFYK